MFPTRKDLASEKVDAFLAPGAQRVDALAGTSSDIAALDGNRIVRTKGIVQRRALEFGAAARAIDTDAVDIVAVSDTMAVDFCQGGGRSVDEDEEGKKQIGLGELHDDHLKAKEVWLFNFLRGGAVEVVGMDMKDTGLCSFIYLRRSTTLG